MEVLDSHRWQLHPDLAESVDLLLSRAQQVALRAEQQAGGAHAAAAAVAASAPTATEAVAVSGAGPLTHMQLRCRDGQGRFVVQFATREAARRALQPQQQAAAAAAAAAAESAAVAAAAASTGLSNAQGGTAWPRAGSSQHAWVLDLLAAAAQTHAAELRADS